MTVLPEQRVKPKALFMEVIMALPSESDAMMTSPRRPPSSWRSLRGRTADIHGTAAHIGG